MLVLGVRLTFQNKTGGKEIGVKRKHMLDNANRMEEGTRRANPMGFVHVIGRDSAVVHSVCHEGISVKLKPA